MTILQPYLDSHCLATKEIQHLREQIQNPDLGDRVKAEATEKQLYWACLLFDANDVIARLYIEHQSILVSIFEGN